MSTKKPKATEESLRERITNLLDSLSANAKELAGGKTEVATTCRSLAQRILDKVSKFEGARRAVFLIGRQGILTLNLVIEKCNDVLASCIVLQIFTALATNKRRCGRLASYNVPENTWHLLIGRHRVNEAGKTDKCSQLCLGILVKLAPSQKNFAMRSRLSGGLPCICAMVKSSSGLTLNPILQLVKSLAVNSTNAGVMLSNGVVDHLTRLLTKAPLNDIRFIKRCVDALVALCKHRTVANSAIQHGLINVTMSLATQWTSGAHIKSVKPTMCTTVLSLMKSLTKHEAGQQALIKMDGLQFLMKLVEAPQTGKKEKETKKLAMVSAGILRCSFPRRPLPVSSLEPVLTFQLPETQESGMAGSDSEEEEENPIPVVDKNRFNEDQPVGGSSPHSPLPGATSPEETKRLEEFKRFFPELLQEGSSPPPQGGPPADEVCHVLPFTETALCDVHPSNSTWQATHDEVQVKIGESAKRRLMMEDANRYIEPEGCINKVVYDFDRLVARRQKPAKTAEEDCNNIFKSPLLTVTASPSTFLPAVPATEAESTAQAKADAPPLQFGSRFESGNLRKVIQVRDHEYDLITNSDINTDHHHQWFYFSVRGMVPGIRYRFNLINSEKPSSQFGAGMQPVMFSQRAYEAQQSTASSPTRTSPKRTTGQAAVSTSSRSSPSSSASSSPTSSTSSVDRDAEGQDQCPGLVWRRVGTDICYYPGNVSRSAEGTGARQAGAMGPLMPKPFNIMTFCLRFPYAEDTCYLAYHYPYTYSRMQRVLSSLPVSSDSLYIRRQSLCTTLSGNDCPVLTITSTGMDADREPIQDKTQNTSDDASASQECQQELVHPSDKQYVVLSARVHPGESNASYMMEGMLEFLVSSHPLAVLLRQRFVFKVIPMLNPDGVINGHHRVSLSGNDLNRTWIKPSQTLHPTIYHTKGLLEYLIAQGKRPRMMCDLHGHSRRKNIFIFGCCGEPPESGIPEEEVFPRLLASVAPSFATKCCKYDVEKSKEATARIVGWRQLGMPASYTMESTYCGADQGRYKGLQFSPFHLKEMGEAFCQALLLLNDPEANTVALQVGEVLQMANRPSPALYVEEGSPGAKKGLAAKKMALAQASAESEALEDDDNGREDDEDYDEEEEEEEDADEEEYLDNDNASDDDQREEDGDEADDDGVHGAERATAGPAAAACGGSDDYHGLSAAAEYGTDG